MGDDLLSPNINGRKKDGTFVPGYVANPLGRPRGARGKAAVLAEALIHADCETIITKLIEAAKAGDVSAAKLLMDRLLPTKKDRHIVFSLPHIKTAADASFALNRILEGVSTGEITPTEGDSLSRLVESSTRIIELTLLEHRVDALEAAKA